MASDLTVTIRGPQGAGKSTLAEAISDLLGEHRISYTLEDDGDSNAAYQLERVTTRRTAIEILRKMSADHGLCVHIATEDGE